MLGAQQFYQPQYNEQTAWQHGGQQNHSSLSHAQQQSSKMAQDTHYTRIAVNQNHINQNSNVRQAANNDAQDNGGASLSMLNQQASLGTEQLSEDNQKVLIWVAELMDPTRREGALMELSKKREQVPELALILWHSFGVMTSLLQEIISVYPLLNPSQLTAAASNRVCNALALLQCVASHNETRGLFLNGKSGVCDNVNVTNPNHSAYSIVPISFSQHDFEIATLRVSTPHVPWSDRRSGQK